ncbi:MAG: hypothetical protein KDA80_00335 [Planctomycetaceae bacterium]|nr:hypothetical protein [Planctomycetaceae bacterium]
MPIATAGSNGSASLVASDPERSFEPNGQFDVPEQEWIPMRSHLLGVVLITAWRMNVVRVRPTNQNGVGRQRALLSADTFPPHGHEAQLFVEA